MNVSHGSMTIFLKSFYMPLTDIRKCAENLNSYGYITSFTSDILYGGGRGGFKICIDRRVSLTRTGWSRPLDHPVSSAAADYDNP